MTLADLSIKRPVFAWMLMFGIILFGLICYQQLGVSYMPDVDYPTLTIYTNWPGAAPEVMESEIIDPIEQRVVSVEGVRQVRTDIGQGRAWINLEFESSRNIDAALQEVEVHVQGVRLPTNVSPPIIWKRNLEDEPIMRVVVYGDMPLRDMADYVDKYLQDTLQTVPGVGDVSVDGFGSRQLRIWIDNDKLKKYQLSVLDVQQAIEAQHEETAGGYLENGKNEINVRTMGEGTTADKVGDEMILKRGGESIYNTNLRIRDVARVEDGLSDQRTIVRTDGHPAVVINIRKQRGQNEVTVADNVRKRLATMAAGLPPGMKVQVTVDYSRFTKNAVDQTLHELFMAGILTSIICYLFLGSWSSAVNVLVAIPTSIIGAFMALYLFHFTLNLFTLLALALAIGIVVDDAIMVLENIVRHFDMGKSRVKAARDGAREITFAAVAATVAVVAIFIPVAFMNGIIGHFFFQFSMTITVAVLFSLLEAITLTPMRCSKILTKSNKEGFLTRRVDRLFHMLACHYRRTLDWALNRRWWVLGGSAALFALSLTAVSYLRQEFVPMQDQNFFHLWMEMPMGSSLTYTDDKMHVVEHYIRNRPEVAHYVSNTGGGDRANVGSFDIVLVDKSQRKIGEADLMTKFREDLAAMPEMKGIRFGFWEESGRGLSTWQPSPVAFNVRGADYDKLAEIVKTATQELEATGLVTDMTNNYRIGMPEARIVPDRAAAADRGISIDAIVQTVNVAIGGATTGMFTSDGHRYDIDLRLEGSDRMQPIDLQKLDVRNEYGELIPLGQVSQIEVRPSLQTMSRINRQRSIFVDGNLVPGVSQAKAIEMVQNTVKPLLPPGYDFYLVGIAAGYKEAFNNLWFALILGVVIAYMVLATQFDSFLHPVSVLLALPFSLTGALVALWMTNESLNMFSMIGIILLMGIVKKNSILLVEFTNQVRAQDKRPLRAALLDACPIRLRPILMTSLATMSSAIPSALGFGPGSETRMPMATAVIGGIFVSTCFTLFVVPCAYSVLARWEGKRDEEEESESSDPDSPADAAEPESLEPGCPLPP
ncbi:MAG: efflux RND transporter permease subunit [Methylacidiphilales bacterium]|nr:efflux RND transporter permease subunit [Candidatus Methylacidiphilales bacterium]